jgi:hypothetical protein
MLSISQKLQLLVMMGCNSNHAERWNFALSYFMVKLTTGIFTHEAGTDFEYSITDAIL